MKSSPSHAALSIEIKPSRMLYAAVSVAALCALGAICYAVIPLGARLLVAAGALGYAWYSLRLQSRQRGRLTWRDDWLWQQSGKDYGLQLHSVTLWPGLIVLSFRAAATRRRLTLTLWRDSLDADDARRLRVYLRHLPVFGV